MRITTNPIRHQSSLCTISHFVWQILSFGDDDVFKLDIALHNDATEGEQYLDMHAFDIEVALKTGCMKVVFLNKFVQSVLVRIIRTAQSSVKVCLQYLSVLRLYGTLQII